MNIYVKKGKHNTDKFKVFISVLSEFLLKDIITISDIIGIDTSNDLYYLRTDLNKIKIFNYNNKYGSIKNLALEMICSLMTHDGERIMFNNYSISFINKLNRLLNKSNFDLSFKYNKKEDCISIHITNTNQKHIATLVFNSVDNCSPLQMYETTFTKLINAKFVM